MRRAALPLLAALLGLLQMLLPLPWLRTAAWVVLGWVGVQLGCWLLLRWPAQRGWWQEPAKILRDLTQLGAGSAVTLVILHQQAGVNLVGLMTTSAVLTAVLGLAAQQTLKDLFAGITLQLDPPFQLGDWVVLGDEAGVVESLTLMHTRLRNVEGARIAVPNASVVQTGLRRFRSGEPVGTRLQVGLDYALPPEQAMALIGQVLANHPLVLAEPPPRIWLHDYGESALVYELLIWNRDPRTGVRNQICSELRSQLWHALAREGWSIPFPVRELQPRRPPTDRRNPSRLEQAELRRLLSRNPLLGGLQETQRTALAGSCRVVRFGAGEVVIRQGDLGDCLYQVVDGRLAVELEAAVPDQAPAVVAELTAGDVFGEMGLFAGEPRSATVRALTACLVLEVQRHQLAPLLEEEPALAERFAALIAERRAARDQQRQPANSDNSTAHLGLAARIRQLLQQVGS